MNSIDLYSCSTLEGKAITYYRSKTKDRRLDKAKMKVMVPPILQPLMEKYQDQTKIEYLISIILIQLLATSIRL